MNRGSEFRAWAVNSHAIRHLITFQNDETDIVSVLKRSKPHVFEIIREHAERFEGKWSPRPTPPPPPPSLPHPPTPDTTIAITRCLRGPGPQLYVKCLLLRHPPPHREEEDPPAYPFTSTTVTSPPPPPVEHSI
ncbi:protein TonB-like isoform X1 [Nilaparvata lugens]|uniref:protein TonB-like isoform X1 n=1 Tax=Nilaparvata lugens TaxID=108931 RepID=UPI00193CEC96|nr:protein TonB-like isoform X1 [Nilaparvata lugens]